jgi:putative SOS response-associated peptidase YedK
VCGRATLVTPGDELREVFDLSETPALTPRYNIAPSQPIAVIRVPRRLELLKWGPKFINAKVEGVTARPANRCLVVLDGFYEWRSGDRQPFYFHRVDRKPFAVGGVTRTAEEACAIVTCPAGEGMIDIHDRMPLVLARVDWERWLDGEKPDATLAGVERYPVARLVNDFRNEDPRCIEPLPADGR